MAAHDDEEAAQTSASSLRGRGGVALLAGAFGVAALGSGRYFVGSDSGNALRSGFRGVEVLAAVTARNCSNFKGVKLVEAEDKTSLWAECVPKWTDDCTSSGCCTDANMKCFQKDSTWAACMESCDSKEKLKTYNETWSCDVIEPPHPRTQEGCVSACQDDETCKQVVYDADNGGSCSSSKKASSGIAWAGDNFFSAICGTAEEMESDETNHLIEEAWKQLPFETTPWPLVNCSWGGEDCSKTKCCNDYVCDKNYEACYGFTCYKKTEYFSGCVSEPPGEGWDGEIIGWPREHRVIPPAGEQVAVQGNSLYCFTVVTWGAPSPKPFWNTEKEIAENWQQNGLHVLQCDLHDIIDGVETPRAEWGSFSNIDMFLDVWQKVNENGKWKDADWTVKVDSDAVFLPHRLKDHLFNLRTPKGSRVYIENTWFKFKFMGALEVMTREAADVFIHRAHECIRGEHAGGEDSFTKGCLDGLGVDHQSDDMLLRDKYAGQEGPCDDGWYVAYHYMKKVHDWSACYNEVMCGDPCFAGPCCDGAIATGHDPGWVE